MTRRYAGTSAFGLTMVYGYQHVIAIDVGISDYSLINSVIALI
jgi:hypothetical protein